MKAEFSLGVDYGTNSVRALIVRLEDGSEVASEIYEYAGGESGVLSDPKNPLLARQNPMEYIEGFYRSVKGAVEKASENGFRPEACAGIGIDATGSTPIPVDREGVALACREEFAGDLAAYAWLWKDHTSHEEANEITRHAARQAARGGDDYLAKCGGTYSSEWFWSKILHCKRESPKVFEAAWSWVEQSDFIPAFLVGKTDPDTMPRGVCAAGHKGLYHESWGGFPSESFLHELDPDLARLRKHLSTKAQTCDRKAGGLTAEIARRVGLPAGLPVAVGAIDAHLGAVGAGIKPGTLVKIIGTSTCDMMVHPLNEPLADIPGLCGIVPGSILPGMYGLEAGQSAVGDIFQWFVRNLVPDHGPGRESIHDYLTEKAGMLKPGESGLLALDWTLTKRKRNGDERKKSETPLVFQCQTLKIRFCTIRQERISDEEKYKRNSRGTQAADLFSYGPQQCPLRT